jgi:hypothetical protein
MRKTLILAVLATLLVAATAVAQKKDGPKLYRWVDKQGKVHFDQALPPEAVEQARTEFNTETGRTLRNVDRALTDEERAAEAAAAKAAALAQMEANEQKRQEDIMMASYETEIDLRRAYGERIGLLQVTIESTDVSIKSLRENLAEILAQASDTELSGRRVLEDRAQTIREMHAEKSKQQALQARRRSELAALNAEFARMLGRYRELRSAATTTAPAATAPASAPVGG